MNLIKKNMALISGLEREIEILERNLEILKTLKNSNQLVGIINLSVITKLPQHLVRYSLRLLSQDGLITPSQKGAVITGTYSNSMAIIK